MGRRVSLFDELSLDKDPQSVVELPDPIGRDHVLIGPEIAAALLEKVADQRRRESVVCDVSATVHDAVRERSIAARDVLQHIGVSNTNERKEFVRKRPCSPGS